MTLNYTKSEDNKVVLNCFGLESYEIFLAYFVSDMYKMPFEKKGR